MTNKMTDSDDLGELEKIVELDTLVKSVHWEIFGTPEYTGGVPGPTDFVTLIAEVPRLDQVSFERRSKAGVIWIAPEAARPWISSENRSMLAKYRNSTVDLSILRNCRLASGKLKKTGQKVDGFVCNNSTKAFIYLILLDPSTS